MTESSGDDEIHRVSGGIIEVEDRDSDVTPEVSHHVVLGTILPHGLRRISTKGFRIVNVRIRSIALSALLLLGVAIALPHTQLQAQETNATAEASPDAYGGTVQKDVLIDDSSDASAPGETLSLTRYTIPAGAKLPVHYHPGVQLASVESGELTYHVVQGELYVTRADGTKTTYESGATVVLAQGDAWEEPEGMIHYAENLTDQPVVLISTALLESDKDATILVDATPAPSSSTPVG